MLIFPSTQALALLHLNHHPRRPLLTRPHNQRIILKQSPNQQIGSSPIQSARYRTPRRSSSPQPFSLPTACPALYLSFHPPSLISLSTYPLPPLHPPPNPPTNLHLQRLQTHLSNIHFPLLSSDYRPLLYRPSSLLEPSQFLKQPKISKRLQPPRPRCRRSSSTNRAVVVCMDDPSTYQRHSVGRFKSIAHRIRLRNQ